MTDLCNFPGCIDTGCVRRIGCSYEAMNMAVIWKLPIIYVIENNRCRANTACNVPRLTEACSTCNVPAYSMQRHAESLDMTCGTHRSDVPAAFVCCEQHGIPCGMLSRAARYPMRHGIPRNTVSHAARSPIW